MIFFLSKVVVLYGRPRQWPVTESRVWCCLQSAVSEERGEWATAGEESSCCVVIDFVSRARVPSAECPLARRSPALGDSWWQQPAWPRPPPPTPFSDGVISKTLNLETDRPRPISPHQPAPVIVLSDLVWSLSESEARGERGSGHLRWWWVRCEMCEVAWPVTSHKNRRTQDRDTKRHQRRQRSQSPDNQEPEPETQDEDWVGDLISGCSCCSLC